MPGSFFDTSVLIYIASAETTKADRAEQLLRQGGIVSVQVLNEIANVARRKMQMSWAETRAFLTTLRALVEVRPVTAELHEDGLSLAERYNLSVYDALIAAAALQADCDTLRSEDLQHGFVIDSRLRVVNPFLPSN